MRTASLVLIVGLFTTFPAFVSGGATEPIFPVGPARTEAQPVSDLDAPPGWPEQSRLRLAPQPSRLERRLQARAVSTTKLRVGEPCSPAAFAALSGSAFVDAIANASDYCLSTLWTYDADVAAVCAPVKVVEISTAIQADCADLIANAERLRRMSLYYQIAFYHEFYESGLTYDGTTHAAAQTAMAAIAGSGEFEDETGAVRNLRAQWAISVDSTNATHLAIDAVQWMLDRYHADPALALDWQERYTAYSLLFSITRQIGNNRYPDPTQSPWYDLLTPDFVDSLAALALDTAYPPEAEYVVNNAVWTLGFLSYLNPATAAAGHIRAATSFGVHALYSAPWLWAVKVLETFYGARLPDGTPLDVAQIRADVRAFALPNHFTFDQERLQIETAIAAAPLQALYDALQEVESQFFRQCTFLTPVADDHNEVVTLVIYGSPSDYDRYQPFLFGLPTDNGGIFIEQTGMLFTYDRTPSESYYSLEELVRHEFTHYLDSRFNISGSFGDPGSLYDNDRLTWYLEGLAESLAGSTRTVGVLPRRKLLELIAGDGADRMTVAQIIGTAYGTGFRFYQYAGLFFNYLRGAHPELLVQLHDRIRDDDASAVDALWAELATDAAIQAEYDAYLTEQIALAHAGGSFAEDFPTTLTPPSLPENNVESIAATLSEALGVWGELRVWAERYRSAGTLSVGLYGATEDWPVEARSQFTSCVDGWLATLAPYGVNYVSTTSWFGDIEIDADSALAHCAIALEGPYRATDADTTPPAAPTNLSAVLEPGCLELRWDAVPDVDLAGYRVYRSQFAGGPYAPLEAPVAIAPAQIIEPVPALRTYYAVCALDASGNESALSNPAVFAAPILLVNGYFDSGTYYVNAYRAALDELGYAYAYWSVPDQGPVTAELIGAYFDGIVIWSIGYYYLLYPDQFNAAQRAIVTDYLDAGGALVLSGAYTALYLDETLLFTDYLHVQHVAYGVDLPEMIGVAGSIGAGQTLHMDYLGYLSEVDPTLPASAAWRYDPSSGDGQILSSGTAVSTVTDGHRATYLAFPFADIQPADRTEALNRILQWMWAADQPGDLDGDGSVDPDDVAVLFDCLRGPQTAPGCEPDDAARSDSDLDGDVDLADAAGFQRVYSTGDQE